MNREEFLKRLEVMLDGVNQGEKAEAMQYYNDYFDDAGIENEEEVMTSLESPEKVAKIIKQELVEKASGENEAEEDSAYSESIKKQEEQKQEQKKEYSNKNQDNQTNSSHISNHMNGSNDTNQTKGSPYKQEFQKKETNGWKIALMVLLVVVLSPIVLPIAGSIFAVAVALLATVFSLVIGFGASGIALVIAGVALFGVGIVKLFIVPMAGLCIIGASLIVVAIGLLLIVATVALCGKFIPWIIRGFVTLCKMPFKQKGACAA